jgi:hypothetical protein
MEILWSLSPVISTVNGIPITELMEASVIDRIIQRTRNGGAEIVGLLKTGGAYHAPAASVRAMIESILLNRLRLLPVSAYLKGEYGFKDVFLGVPCLLGCRGVERILELQLTDPEQTALADCAAAVQRGIDQANAVIEVELTIRVQFCIIEVCKGHYWFRQGKKSDLVIQAESESSLVNPRFTKLISANNIKPFARVQAAVA